jgi:3-hydroxyisobutyrate dehydrogenase-like beta-hydroxyacid dehydrogenase
MLTGAPTSMATPQEQKRIGVIGLGLMGTALAERLLAEGYRVAVWNRTPAKAEPLVAQGAEWSDNPLVSSRRVIISLYTSDIVGQVIEALAPGLQKGQILIDTTTGEPAQTAALGRHLNSLGAHYLNSPISGSSEQARRGEATLIVGGEKEAYDACADLWRSLSKGVYYVGSCDSAAKMKLVVNLVLGLNRAALAEGLAFAESIGVEPAAALAVLTGSMAYSRVMEVKGRKMIERDFLVQARLSQHLKDVRMMLKAAQDCGLDLPLSERHCVLLEKAEVCGLGDLDNSAIIEILRRGRTSAK